MYKRGDRYKLISNNGRETQMGTERALLKVGTTYKLFKDGINIYDQVCLLIDEINMTYWWTEIRDLKVCNKIERNLPSWF